MPNNYNTKRRRPSSPHCHSAAKPIKSVKPLLSEKSLSPPRSLDNLIKWLRGQSCTINKVVEKTGPRSGRGLFASEDIEEGELLIGINEETLINADTNSLVDHYGLDLWTGYSVHQQLTLFLLLEDGFFSTKEYLLSLPAFEDFAGTPLVWTEEWRDKLPPAAKQYFLHESCKPYIQDIEAIAKFFEERNLEIPPPSVLMHAWLCVNTRCVYWHYEHCPAHDKNNMTLAPLIDMINHVPTASENVSVSRVDNTLQIRATTHIAEGEEIGFSYHSATSRFWICEYGFHLPFNDHDDLDLTAEIENLVTMEGEGKGGKGGDKKGKERQEWLEQEGYWGEYTISADGEVSFRIQIALRTICGMKKQDVKGFMMGEREGTEEQPKVDGILRDILEGKVRECEESLKGLNGEGKGIEERTVRLLWEDELQIAKAALSKLTDTFVENGDQNGVLAN